MLCTVATIETTVRMMSGPAQWEKQERREREREREKKIWPKSMFSRMFVDACRVSIDKQWWNWKGLGVGGSQKTAANRRFWQETRRFHQNPDSPIWLLPFCALLEYFSANVYPPQQKNYLRKKILEELFSGPLRQFCVINCAKKFSEKYFLGIYVNFA